MSCPRVKLSEKTLSLLSVFNENRIKILKILFCSASDECGTDLVQRVNIQKSLLSYHLSSLEALGFVEEVKCGKFKNYRIAKKNEQKVKLILEMLGVKI